MIMKAAAFMNLPVHAGLSLSEYLHAVHAQIVFAFNRAFSINQGQGKKRSAIILPAADTGQGLNVDRMHGFLQDRGPV